MSVTLRRPNERTYWVNKQLLAGSYPVEYDSAGDLRPYLECGVNFFVDLTEEESDYQASLQNIASTRKIEVEYHRFAIEDFEVPEKAHMKQILDCIDEAISSGKTVFVHCLGGIGRTGMVVGCYLTRHGDKNALDTLNRLFKTAHLSSDYSPETKEQADFVRSWSEL